MAALDLYRDLDLWPIENGGNPRLAIFLVEEPETGLHPEAQRQLASSLRGWATYGLQLVVVTHSPVFVNAAPPTGLRLARRADRDTSGESREPTIVRPTDLGQIRESLGVRPSDVLLARRFVIVEGSSDQLVLTTWARRLGYDLRASGVQLVPSHGFGFAKQVARFLDLAYEGAEFIVVLDNGADTARTQLEIDAQFGGRVRTRLLSRAGIEGYYDAAAIVGWLRLAGTLDGDLQDQVAGLLDSARSRGSALEQLAKKHLDRSFDKQTDGLAIANLMPEHAIDPEIQDLLHAIGAE